MSDINIGNSCVDNSMEAGAVDSVQITSTTNEDVKMAVDNMGVANNFVNGYRNIWSLFDFSKRVLVVGDIMVDKYIHGTCTRIAPESWVPVFTEEKEEYRIGGTGNVVNNITAMGLSVDIVTVVGRSDEHAINRLKHDHVNTNGIVLADNVCLKTITRYVSNQTLCFRTDNEQHWQISENVQDMVHEKIQHLMTSRNYSVVVLSDYGQGLLSKKVVQLVVTKCRQQGIPTIVDPGKRGKYERFTGINMVKLNHREAAKFSQNASDISVACEEICKQLQAQACVITLSDKGMAFYHYSSRHFQSVLISKQVTTTDVCGAGDTVLAALTFGVCHKWSLFETCQFANACAANVVQTFGVTSVLMIDVIPEKVLKTKNELFNLRSLIPKHKTVVLTTGCFDLIHVGHIASLRHAKEQGDILIVALNSDVSVKSYKGDKRPIFPVDQRCRMLLATKHVDFIVIFDESIPHWIVDIVDPDVFVKGEEYCNKDLKSLFPNLRKIVYTPQISGTSTTIIIEQIKHY